MARADGSLRGLLERLSRIDVLVIDDWAMSSLSEPERRDFWEICEDRYQVRSTLTSQRPVSRWHERPYLRTGHSNMHVRGYEEKGNINTPMELAINNEIDRFTLAIVVIDGTPKLQRIGAHAKENYRDQQTDCRNYAYAHGIDKPEIVAWRWSFLGTNEKQAREGRSRYQGQNPQNYRSPPTQ
jgi:hypothetical protein